MTGLWRIAWCAAGFLLISSALHAGQNEILRQGERTLPELVTDRPDFTEATAVIAPGVIQIEMGMTMEREGSVRHFSSGEMLMRTGLGRRMELRLGSDGLSSQRSPNEPWRRGVSDAEIGLKIGLSAQRRYLPAISVIPILSLPTGSKAFSSGTAEPTAKLAWSKDLSNGFSLGGNVNLSFLRAPSGRLTQKAYSLSVGRELGAGFGGYWEVYALSPWEEGSGNAWIANTGVARAVGKHAQWDCRVGKRMTKAGPDWFVGAGFTFRQPTRFFAR